MGPETDQLFLVLYGTGARSSRETSSATAIINEVVAQVQFLGPAPGLVGVEQINVQLPRSLKGINQDVDVKFSLDGIAANTVKIFIL